MPTASIVPTDTTARERRRAWVSLALLLPAPTLGVLCGMFWFPDSALGQSLFAASKLWILVLPLVWHLAVDRRRLSLSPARRGGFGMAIALGVGLSAAIALAYLAFGAQLIDPAFVRAKVQGVGLATPLIFIGGALYWSTINAALEEYVWRWFVVQQCERGGAGRWAIPLSAAGFTLHHGFAMATYFSWPVTLLACAGIFIAGAAWSWCYVRSRSIWPGYISHVLGDITIFIIGYHLIFGFGG